MYRSPQAGAGFPSRGPFEIVSILALACLARADLTLKENPVSSVPVGTIGRNDAPDLGPRG